MSNKKDTVDELQDSFKTLGKEDLSKYRLSTPKEVERTFKELIFKKEMVTVRIGETGATLLTTILDIIPEKGMFVFDKGQNQHTNTQLERANRLYFDANPNQVEVRFTSDKAASARYHGEAVFAAPIPPMLYRVQRREFFRVDTPILNPITCQISGSNGVKLYDLFDISIGGIGINDPHYQIDNDLSVYDILEDCVLHIPDYGDVKIDLEIRSIYEKRRNVKQIRRLGLAYKELSNIHMTAIQRYINKRQLEKRAHELDLD
ncbi:MAG: flagellar brake protein [Gammaproteobacteria bacterium]|nr:flagellar brake protein [Gammaproteobacteria bacterium]